MEEDIESNTSVLDRDETEEPKMYNVIMLNDNYTPMDFVIIILVEFFGKSTTEATKIMYDIHLKGSGIAGTYIQDIAETKSQLVNKVAYENNYPLRTKTEIAE